MLELPSDWYEISEWLHRVFREMVRHLPESPLELSPVYLRVPIFYAVSGLQRWQLNSGNLQREGFRFEQRGKRDGQALDDWLQAESELEIRKKLPRCRMTWFSRQPSPKRR